MRKFLRTAAATRLHAAWRLSLYGLRRGEVLGLRWFDIDLKAKTLTVDQATSCCTADAAGAANELLGDFVICSQAARNGAARSALSALRLAS